MAYSSELARMELVTTKGLFGVIFRDNNLMQIESGFFVLFAYRLQQLPQDRWQPTI
jgi:hypothetical protein